LPEPPALLAFIPGGRDEFLRSYDAARARLGIGDDAPPARLAGRYELLGAIGRGATGTVRVARDHVLHRDVAIKFVDVDRIGLSETPGLLREAEVLAKFEHANIVTVYDAGIADREVYVVMSLVKGITLDAWWRETPRTWREVVEAFKQAGRGLQAAHQHSIVHRDFKPANAMIDASGTVRVLDFGVARGQPETLPDGVDVARTGTHGGTRGYTAPEQYDGHIDHRSDQFAFCASLFEVLFGVLPCDAGAPVPDPKSLSAQVRARSRLRRGVPAWLCRAVLRGLEHDPAARHADMGALLDALDHRTSPRRTAVAFAALGAIVVGAWSLRPDPCADDGQVATLWSSERARNLDRAGDAMERSSVDDALRRFVARWTELSEQSCRAHESGGIDDALFAARRECLERARRQVDALIVRTLEPEFTAWRLFGSAVLDAVRLERCQDDVGLLAGLPPDGGDPDRATALEDAMAQASVHAMLGEHDAYKAALLEVEATSSDPERAPAQTLWLTLHLGRALLAETRYAEAESRLRPALLAAQRWHRWPEVEGALMWSLAEALSQQPGRGAEARLLAEQAVATVEASPIARAHLGHALHALALAQFAEGRLAEALATLDRAAAQTQGPAYLGQMQASVRQWRASSQNLRGLVLEALGRSVEAEVAYRDGLLACAELGAASLTEASLLNNLGVLVRHLGRPGESMELQRRAAAMKATLGRRDLAAATMINIGNLQYGAGEHAAAVSTFDEVLVLLSAAPNDATEKLARLDRAYALQAAGRLDDAIADYDRASKLAASSAPADTDILYAAAIGRGTALLHRGERVAAAREFDAALAIESPVADPYDRAELRFGLARSLGPAMASRADALAEEAESLARGAGEAELAGEILRWRRRPRGRGR